MTYSIRLIDYMGDLDDYNTVNLIGPYPDAAARNRDLWRLQHLPLGASEFHGGAQFEASSERPRKGWGYNHATPEQVAAATDLRTFYALFYGYDLDEDDQTAEIEGQLALGEV